MARIWQTGFELGSNSIFDVQQGAGSPSSSPTRGSWSAYSSGSLNSSIASLPGNFAEIYGGFGIRRGGEFSINPISFGDANTDQLRLYVSSTGTLEVRRGDGTSLGIGTIVLTDLTWVFVEFHFTISDTIGVIDTKVNGVTDLALTNKDTKNTANAFVNQIRIDTGGGIVLRLDDIVVNDTTTAQNNSFPTDTKITALIPNAVGDRKSTRLNSSHS